MKVWIFTGGEIFPDLLGERPDGDALCIAADGGLRTAEALGVKPQLIVGDYDSLGHEPPKEEGVEVITLPSEKDVTDTQFAVECALCRHADEIVLVGGLGGRLDHTLSNLAILEDLDEKRVRCLLVNGQNRVRLLHSTSLLLAKTDYTYVSLLALDEKIKGVDIEGVKYPLRNKTLLRSFGFAVSNEITGNCCLISVRKGRMLVVESRDAVKK